MRKISVDFNEPPLTEAQVLAISTLTEADIAQIDGELLRNVIESWRKNAMVVGLTMIKMQGRLDNVPDVYFVQRLVRLVEQGQLESQGNLLKMGRGEVRHIPSVQP